MREKTKYTGLSLPQEVFDKLEEKRGIVSRSAYVREVLKAWWENDQELEVVKGGDSGEE